MSAEVRNGVTESIENHEFHIPTGLTREDADKAGPLYLIIKHLGPDEMWDDLEQMRKEYITRFFQGKN